MDEKNIFFHPKQEMGWRKRYCMEKKTDVLCVYVWLDEKIVVSSQRRMGWRRKGYFVVGNIYIWLFVVPVLLDEKNSFFIPKNNGTEKKHSSEKLKYMFDCCWSW